MAVEIKFPEINFKVEVEGEVAKVVTEDYDAYVNCITEATGLKKKDIKAVEDASAEYLKEAIKVATEKAGDVFKENSNVARVDVKIPFGVNKSDYIETMIVKEKEYRNPTDGSTWTAPAIKVAVHNKYAKVGKSYIKSLREALTERIK